MSYHRSTLSSDSYAKTEPVSVITASWLDNFWLGDAHPDNHKKTSTNPIKRIFISQTKKDPALPGRFTKLSLSTFPIRLALLSEGRRTFNSIFARKDRVHDRLLLLEHFVLRPVD